MLNQIQTLGIEIDMLSLGDADALLITSHTSAGIARVLVDGGKSSDAAVVKEFLHWKGATNLYAIVCTHGHNDHANGLIKLVQDNAITFSTAWMHDIRDYASAEDLRRASASNSSDADGVRQVVETSRQLWSAFWSRKVVPQAPFAGSRISTFPDLVVLGPSLPYYKNVLAEFTKVEEPYAGLWAAISSPPASPLSGIASLFAPPPPNRNLSALASLLRTPRTGFDSLPSITGVLGNSSVEEKPKTQPYNNTSVILGASFQGSKLLLTADAGSEALDRIPADWKNVKWMQIPHHGSDGNLSQTNIERFRPELAYVSASGDSSHPSRAIVSGLIKVGSQVFSTHQNNHLWFGMGVANKLPPGYVPAVPMKGTGSPIPVNLAELLLKRG